MFLVTRVFVRTWQPSDHMQMNHTKYDIYCPMVIYVNMVTFWMTLVMNK